VCGKEQAKREEIQLRLQIIEVLMKTFIRDLNVLSFKHDKRQVWLIGRFSITVAEVTGDQGARDT
jgi:hypothetical protein